MKKNAEETTKDFFRAIFGKLIADIIFEQKLKQFSVGKFNDLDNRQKVEIGQTILESVFGKFYTIEKIENMKVFYLLRFSLDEAARKGSEMTKKECDLEVMSPNEVVDLNFDQFFERINDENNIKFVFEWSEMLEGHLIVTLDKITCLKLANLIMETMLGKTPDNRGLDEMKRSSVKEFLNIILPVFSKVIGDSFQQVVFFTPTTYEKFKSKYTLDDQFMMPQKVIHSKVNIKIDNSDNLGEFFLFIKNSTGRFKELLDQAKLYKDPFDQFPAAIFVKSSGNVRNDLEMFFKMLKIGPDRIDIIMKSIFRHNLENFEYRDFINFYQMLISEYIDNATEVKKENIKINLSFLLGMQKQRK